MSLLTIWLRRSSVHPWHSPGSVVAPGWSLRKRRAPAGKPMPVAGETVHVRRLLVDRSRCGLEVSPARTGGTGSPRERRRAVVAMEAANPSAGGCGDEDQVGRASAIGIISRSSTAVGSTEMDITFKGRHTTVPERFRRHAAAKLAKLEKLDA